MRKDILNTTVEHSTDEIAGEFLRVQEVRRPNTIEELQQATTSANDEIERVLFHRDRWRAMKTEDQEESTEQEVLYDEWVDVTLDLEEAFIDENAGALGERVVELLALDAGAFAECTEEARFILQQTTPMALRVYPFTHRLVDLGIANDRAAVVERLSSGDLVKQEKIHNVSVTPRRRTIIGLLRDLDARLPLTEQTDIWSLEVAPELPAVAVISDPFQSGNEDLATYWGQRISGAHETYGRTAAILSLSGDKTASVTYELENIAEQAGDEVLKHAAKSIATWLEGKQMYYTDPDPRDFELYHLGMEEPQQLMEIMRSLDVIKHFDPELFFELIGIDPSQGGRSLYFGSFLHKALFNTQRTLDHASPELGQMALQTMMNQLRTLDERVQTYSAVVSQESLRSMAGEMKKSVDAANTKESKAQTLMMMAVPFSRMAIDAEVRRQLDAMREASSENVVEELRRRIDDIEHPLKLAEYVGLLPASAEHDVRVMKELRKIFGDVPFAIPHLGCLHKIPERLKPLYDRIPLIDETRKDLGFGLRIKVAVRDALTFINTAERMMMVDETVETPARKFLKGVMRPDVFREDFEAVQDQFGLFDRQIAGRFSYASRKQALRYSGRNEDLLAHMANEVDSGFYVGQMFIAAARSGSADDFFVTEPFNHLERYHIDLAFLSILAHPQGKAAAFKYFDKFCDMIPAERMCELLNNSADPIRQFVQEFKGEGSPSTSAYLEYLRSHLPFTLGNLVSQGDRPNLYHLQSEHLEILRKINHVSIEGKTPWTKTVAIDAWNSHGNMGFVIRVVDAWEIWRIIGRKTLNPIEIMKLDPRAWDDVFPATAGTMVRGHSTSALAAKLVSYFRLSTEPPTSAEVDTIRQYVEQKRDQKFS